MLGKAQKKREERASRKTALSVPQGWVKHSFDWFHILVDGSGLAMIDITTKGLPQESQASLHHVGFSSTVQMTTMKDPV